MLGGLAGAAPAQERVASGTRPPSRVDYEIHATLDGETKELDGRETITWENKSSDTVGDLWFHLYLNAFAHNRSSHLEEQDGKVRDRENGGRMKVEDGWGWTTVTSLAVRRGDEPARSVMDSFEFRQPDDENAEDRTVFRVALPEPVAPGETLVIELEWESQLPRVRRRTGYKDDFLLVAQWFPKLAVYEDGRGWNAHQFHSRSEWFSDYGFYDVTLDLPERYAGKVGGSGKLKKSQRDGDRVIVTFLAPSAEDRERLDHTGRTPLVHDFTWTADPLYEVHDEYRFRYAEWASRFPEEVAKAEAALGHPIRLRDVDVTVLIHPERARQAERHFKATSAALFFYGLWFGEYPYEHITVVDPPWGGRAAGGMEYPTLFTCGTNLGTTEDMHTPEGVTVHEAGHQFWYGLVGNNEFEAAWLDEGLNSYADSEVLIRTYGPRRGTTRYARLPMDGVSMVPRLGGSPLADALTGRSLPLPFLPELKPMRSSGFLDWWRDQPAWTFYPQWSDPRWSDRSGYLSNAWPDPIDTWAWEYVDESSYGTNSYPRPAVVLRTLKGLVGEEAFVRGMNHFGTTFRYGHPYALDFFETFQEGAQLDEDLDWFFADLFQGTGTVDYSVGVDQRRRPERIGMELREGGRFAEPPEDEEEEPAPQGDDSSDDDAEGEEDEDEEDEDEPWLTDITLRRRGELRLPLDVELVFEDGETERFVWTREEQARERWLKRELVGERKLEAVVLDPDQRYWIDADLSNNRWYDETDEVAPWRWGERVFTRTARMLQFWGGLGG